MITIIDKNKTKKVICTKGTFEGYYKDLGYKEVKEVKEVKSKSKSKNNMFKEDKEDKEEKKIENIKSQYLRNSKKEGE